MIKYYYQDTNDMQLGEIDRYQKGSWIYAQNPSDSEMQALADEFELEPGHLEDARDEDEMPRLEREGDKTYLFVRFAYKNSRGDIETAPLLILLAPDFVLTMSPVHVPALDVLLRRRGQLSTKQRAKLILLILSNISDQYDMFINQTSRQIKVIRARLRSTGISNQDLIAFVTIEDELNEFLTSLQPTNAALRRLLIGRQLRLEEDQDIVEDLLLNNEQSIEGIRSNLRSISNIRESYSAISTNNLNKTITWLTLATILVALPNVFFGMYGMNVPLPLQRRDWIFPVIIGVNVSLIIAIFIFVRRKRII
jgi:magnesium transporter